MERDLHGDCPTVLEYARFHGLCTDYTLEQPLVNDVVVLSSDIFINDLQDPLGFPITNPASGITKERLTLNKEAALLLKAVQRLQETFDDELQLPSDDWRGASKLKQEIPILRTDPEVDLLDFGSTNTPSFVDLKIPLEVVDDENDEGFGWPKKYFDYTIECAEKAKSAKLTVPIEDLRFLQSVVTDPWTALDSETIKEQGLSFKPNPAWRHLTPPLLPLTPPLTPYIPSSPDNHLELLSESTNSVAAEAKVLEDRIIKADSLICPGSDGSDAMLFNYNDISQTVSQDLEGPSSPPPKRRMEDLKIEGPLTPLMFPDSPNKKLKSVSFPAMVHEYITELPSHFESGNNVLSSQDSFMGFFKEKLQPHHEEAKKRTEKEKLSQADTISRLDIPMVDFSLPVAPWNEFVPKHTRKNAAIETGLDTQMEFLLHVKQRDLKLVSSWHGLTTLERELTWLPFPVHSRSVSLNEKLHGEEVLGKMLAEPTMCDIATSSADIWKREGLRILEEDGDSEDELDVAEIQEQNDIHTLIHKRKLEMQEGEEEENEMRRSGPFSNVPSGYPYKPNGAVMQSRHWSPASTCQPKSSLPPLPKLAKAPSLPPELKGSDSSLMFGGVFSASSALHKFMALQGKLVKKVDAEGENGYSENQQSPSPAVTLAFHTAAPFPNLQVSPPRHMLSEAPKSMTFAVAPPLPKLPSIPNNLRPCSFIISSTLLQQRSLTRDIEKLYPNAEFIQRDFTTPASPAGEADLLLSPSTGLIFTTLQQLKQRALPGQRDCSPFYERAVKLQYRYERLVVLVSEGLNRSMEELGSSRPVDDRDTEAIKSFETFTSTLEADFVVKYVRGGELALARSIIGEMATWGLVHGSEDIGNIKLLQDETCWELFLRRTGLNTFAAQVILASPKTTHPILINSTSPITSGSSQSVKMLEANGLSAFILMSAQDRVQNFQVLCGGSRVLMRVNRVLEQNWPSAINGFVV